LIQSYLKKVSLYYKFNNEINSVKSQKALIGLPKIMIILPLVVNLIGPQLILLMMDFKSTEHHLHFLTLSYSATMLFGLMFYIPFIRHFEYFGRYVPIDKKYISMSFMMRNTLVILFSMSSVVMLTFLAINGVIKEHGGDMGSLYRDILINVVPLAVVTILLALLNNILLVLGIGHRLKLIKYFMGEISRGNLKLKRLEILSRDEFGLLLNDQNIVLENLKESLGTAKKSTNDTLAVKDELINIAEETSTSAVQITSNIESVNRQINVLDDNVSNSSESIQVMTGSINKLGEEITEQASMVEESTAAITEMIASIDNITTIAHKKADVSESLLKTAENGGEKLGETIQTLSSIHSSIEDIKEITSLIMGIAARTNLLAMNAAIEAAHAGEAGRGFSVVADEIRKLAETSSRSSRKINDNIKEIVSHIEKSSRSSDITVQAFQAVNGEVREVVQAFMEIENGVAELKTGGDQILQAITGLRDISVAVKERADGMLSQTGKVSESVSNLSRISSETKNASQEIGNGAREIMEATEGLSRRTNDLNQYSSILKQNMEKFEI
jgi:methyl-accepting chemotaxis protein